jgi:hypothetical protein
VAGPSDIVPITTQADLDAIWDRMLIRTAPARLPADAATFWVTATGSMGCPAHFAGITLDGTRVTAIFTNALTTGCDRLKVPDSFLVAIETRRLPAAPFQLARTGPAGQPDVVVEVAP